MAEEEIISEEVIAAMGISRLAYEEIQCIIGRMPTVEELSTLLAMWDSNGRQQGLLTWLKGQQHTMEKNDYLYEGTDVEHKKIREPRVKDCIGIAHNLFQSTPISPNDQQPAPFLSSGREIYLMGHLSSDFLHSDYSRQYLHLVDQPMELDSDEENRQYYEMILGALLANHSIDTSCAVGRGGIFGTLLQAAAPNLLGFDILTCREIRLDSFLFGEEGGRFLVSLPESGDDFFLLKMEEARVNCCFLGRTTKGRVVIDGMDFGPTTDYLGKTNKE